MLKIKNSIFIIIMALILLAIIIPNRVYATQITIAPTNTATTPAPSPTPTQKPTTAPTQTVSAVSTTKPNGNLPQTGIEDYTGLFVAIAILGVTALFAYKKIKYYNM